MVLVARYLGEYHQVNIIDTLLRFSHCLDHISLC